MNRMIRWAAFPALFVCAVAKADVGPDAAQKLYERVTPSLVAVKFTWESELGRRELTGAGIVVSSDGLVMTSIGVVDPRIPDAQLKDFKILIPSQDKDAEELDAEFQGRDERTSLAFVKVKEFKDAQDDRSKGPGRKPGAEDDTDDGQKPGSDAAKESSDAGAPAKANGKTDAKSAKRSQNPDDSKGAKEVGDSSGPDKADEDKRDLANSTTPVRQKHDWRPLKFEEAAVRVGEPILSVGLLPEGAAYKAYFMEAAVSATLRGEVPQVLVQGGGLAAVGSPVFNAAGKAIGVVGTQAGQNAFLNDTGTGIASLSNPPKFYTPASDIMQSLKDPPVAGKPLELPWIGVPQMTGLNKDVAEVFNLQNQPAVQVGEVIPDTPAAKAGLKQGDIVVKVNGKPLERGDEPDELPQILRRKVLRMNVGDELTLSVMRKKGQPLKDMKMTLVEQPARPNTSKRFWAEDLGFGARDLTFFDTYARRLPADTKGVSVTVIRPQGSAESGGLRPNDLITQLNGEPVTGADEFQKTYKAARKAKPKEAVVLVVRREGREDTVRIEPPQ